uniref:Uncharacterized protein LOC108950041 n=1 Tax=Phallusia mammillata TaxID=59560 RepID=A0A6F9DK08_9ASCI|nr:uncharacterized protein LOC108950041 [Phallusia mammillata]
MASHFRTRRLTVEDSVGIRQLLMLYINEEVTAKCLQLSAFEKDLFVDTYLKFVVPQGTCIGVFDEKSDEMLACHLNTAWNKHVLPENFNLCQHTPALNKLLRFDEYMLKDAPKIINERPYLHGEIVVANPKIQRRGLAMHLMQLLEDIALEKKFEFIIGVANTNKSKGLVKKLGWQLSNEVRYSEYKDAVTGEAIFKDIPPPHTGAAFCYKELTSKRSCL